MTELALRPRSATEIIDLAVRLLRRHFGAFVTIGLVGAVPILGVQLLFLRAPSVLRDRLAPRARARQQQAGREQERRRARQAWRTWRGRVTRT